MLHKTTRVSSPFAFLHKNPSFFTTKMSSWSCSTCTFINPPSQKSTCKICLTNQQLPPPLSTSSKPKWACNSCTFLNPFQNTKCEICGTRESSSSLSTLANDDFDDDDDEENAKLASVGNVFLPLLPCKRKNREETSSPVVNAGDVDEAASPGFKGIRAANQAVEELAFCGEEKPPAESAGHVDGVVSAGFREVKAANKAVEGLGCVTSETLVDAKPNVVKVLTYNVWFRQDLEMHMRMRALGHLIQLHSPDVICFQEIIPPIYDIFQQSSWWKEYKCSLSREMAHSRGYFCMQLSKLPVKSYSSEPFCNSIMGRELCVAEVEVQPNRTLTVATSHLESPCPGPPKWDQMYSKERVEQAKKAVQSLNSHANVIFCGDMNWCDKLDGQFPLSDGWIDVWSHLRPTEEGFTYDTKMNKMLTGNRSLRKRLDRFVCKLRDYKTSEIEMIGMDAIPGLSYCKEKKYKKEVKMLELPVLPSDHFGLLLTISPL